MTCWLFHKWGNWKEYTWTGTLTITTARDPFFGFAYAANLVGQPQQVSQYRQKRQCSRCGKVQDELVR